MLIYSFKVSIDLNLCSLCCSSDNPFHGGYSHYEEDEFASEQDKTHDDDQTYVRAQPSSSLFNHQSFTDRAHNSRWSKQDTELFYEVNIDVVLHLKGLN